MQKTIFNITKMDCPSEEQLIRMKLQKFDEIKSLEFDIQNRKLTVHHIAEAFSWLSYEVQESYVLTDQEDYTLMVILLALSFVDTSVLDVGLQHLHVHHEGIRDTLKHLLRFLRTYTVDPRDTISCISSK